MIRRWLVACLLGVMAGPALARPPEISPFPALRYHIPRPLTAVLSSGATIYILEDHELPLFSVTVWVRTGTVYDPSAKTGLGSVFSEVFRMGGTRSLSPRELNRALEGMATSLEAGIDDEEMTVGLSALSKNFDRSMDIFQDVMTHPAFNREQFSLEKGQVIESIRRRNDDPSHLGRRYFRSLFYGKEYPRGREPEIETVQAIMREDLVRFYEDYFHPDRMVVSVSGDVQPQAVLKRLGVLFKLLEKFPERPLPSLPSLPPPIPGLYFLQRDLNQSRIVMGAPGLRRHSPDHFSMEVADMIIGGDPSSRMFSEIRSRQGLAYSVDSFSVEHMESGVVGAACETKSQSTVQAVRSIQDILGRSLKEGVSDNEVKFAKEMLVNSFVFHFTSPSQIVDTYARLAYEGYPPDYLQTYTSRLESVNRADVLRVLRSYWGPERMLVLVIGDALHFGEKLDAVGPVRTVPFVP